LTKGEPALFSKMWLKLSTPHALKVSFVLTFLNIPSHLVETVSIYIHCRRIQTSFQSATTTRRRIRARAAEGGLVSIVFFGLKENDYPALSIRVELEQDADDTALVATYRSASLIVGYLKTCQKP
jgi:hypothetical protein